MEKIPSTEEKSKTLTGSQRLAIGLGLTGISMLGGFQLGNDLERMNNPEQSNDVISKTAGKGLAVGTTGAAVVNATLLAGGYKERRRREKENMAQSASVIG